MTVHLKIKSLTQTNIFEGDNLLCVVQGSQSNVLRSRPSKGHNWDPVFQVRCSQFDNLNFFTYDNNKIDDTTFIGQGTFHAKSFIHNHCMELDHQRPFQYQIILEKNDKQRGVLKVDVLYDKAKKYQGELAIMNENLMGGTKKDRVPFYKGRCETTNLFSFMDSSAQGQKFNTIQQKYRDKYRDQKKQQN